VTACLAAIPDVVRQRLPRNGRAELFGVNGDSDNRPVDQMHRVTPALDGIFFSDGEFAGLNDAQLYERTVCDAEAYQEATAVARSQSESGAATHHVLQAVEKITGPVHHPPPAPPPSGRKTDIEELRLQARGWLAWNIAATRQTDGDEKAVST